MSSQKSPSHYLEESPTSPGIGEILAPPSEIQSQQHIAKKQSRPIGHIRWAIAEGYIPSHSTGPEPEMTSHETACLLNASDREANVRITIYFSDREPVGPYRISVPPRRTKHLRFNELTDPQEIPRDTDYSSLIESDVPIVVQHTRLDSRQSANALIVNHCFRRSIDTKLQEISLLKTKQSQHNERWSYDSVNVSKVHDVFSIVGRNTGPVWTVRTSISVVVKYSRPQNHFKVLIGARCAPGRAREDHHFARELRPMRLLPKPIYQ